MDPPTKKFYRQNLIFWIVMALQSEGPKKLLKLKILVSETAIGP